MRVALVHEWLTSYAGSERVLEQLIGLFPSADVFAIVDFIPSSNRRFLQGRKVQTSFMQNLPFGRQLFRKLLFLMPLAVEQFDLSSYDVVISSNHAVAKGVLTGPDQCHVSYVHSPMRYAWDLQHQYVRQNGMNRGLKAFYALPLLHWMRLWDARTANGVDRFVANSNYIARRIWKVYRRDSIVIPPPVDVDRFTLRMEKGNVYLTASRLVPYKRVDLVVEAFAAMPDRQLLVVGSGPERRNVQRAASDATNITFLDEVAQPELIGLMQQAKAFVFAGEEDFGISLVEVQACGTPVIAFGRGGACDIVQSETTEPPTGVLFEEQTTQSIIDAVDRFEANRESFCPRSCRRNALRFSEGAFRERFSDLVSRAYTETKARRIG